MKIGILSDSHGKAKRLMAALRLLADRQVEAIVHCGDIGPPECVQLLGAAPAAAYLVPGNMDRHVEKLRAAAEQCGVTFDRGIVTIPIDHDTHLAATHGSEEMILLKLIDDQQFSYICHGHTHRARDERIGKVRIINPGALRHPRHPRHATVAVLDTAADTVEHIKVR